MATRRRLAALALVLSLVLAGCATESDAFRTTEPETETPGPVTETRQPTRTTTAVDAVAHRRPRGVTADDVDVLPAAAFD